MNFTTFPDDVPELHKAYFPVSATQTCAPFRGIGIGARMGEIYPLRRKIQ